MTTVCDLLKVEGMEACLEYAQMGFEVGDCRDWEQLVGEQCYQTRGNCTTIAYELKEFCRFALQAYVPNPTHRVNYCESTERQFWEYRCPPASYAPLIEGFCYTEEALECEETCGNYRNCYCRERRSTLLGDICHGEPVVLRPLDPEWDSFSQEFVSRGNYSCTAGNQPPEHCRHHKLEGAVCGAYKHCESNLCIINRVSCPNRTMCEEWGTCEPSQGWCKYRNREDGTRCDDSLSYTLDDQCVQGLCNGWIDYCLKYEIQCIPQSVCLTGGSCNSLSGRCTYDKQPDGTPCDDARDYTVEDECQAGVCLGKIVNLCIERGIVCDVPNMCYEPGVCDPLTGMCSDPVAVVDNRECDDNNPATWNSTCIDGICLGKLDINYEFLTLPGRGICTDRDGREMGRYSGDIPEGEDTCRDICLDDVQCLAYGYSYPLCSIYGTVRTQPPQDGRSWTFQLGTVPAAVAVEMVSPPFIGQRDAVCRKKGVIADVLDPNAEFQADPEDWFGFSQLFLVACVAMALFFMCPILGCISVIICPKRVKAFSDTLASSLSRSGNQTALQSFADSDSQPPTPAGAGSKPALEDPIDRKASILKGSRTAEEDLRRLASVGSVEFNVPTSSAGSEAPLPPSYYEPPPLDNKESHGAREVS